MEFGGEMAIFVTSLITMSTTIDVNNVYFDNTLLNDFSATN